jgi:RimJ/RimL family protein N-acetyltransferase
MIANTLFAAGTVRAVELRADDIPALQRFFEQNPDYFICVNGQPAVANEAHEEFHSSLPEGWSFTRKSILGFVDEAGTMVGMANIISDFLAPGVWHIGLYMVATNLHGRGTARALHERMENWMREAGAHWLRLGVVAGNMRAERFWERLGFVEVRQRHGIAMGSRVNTVRVMAKPLGPATLTEYLALVSRDRPEWP